MVCKQSLALLGLGAVLASAAIAYGGVAPRAWNICSLVTGALALMYWLSVRSAATKDSDRWVVWPAALIPAYLALQLIPLPQAVLAIASPVRAQALADLQEAVPAAGNWAPLSVAPAATAHYLARTLGYLAVFLLVREVGSRLEQRCWVLVAPLLAVASMEAAWAVITTPESSTAVAATGTYVNRNHFAGLLAGCAPFAVAYAIAAWRRENRWQPVSVGAALKTGVGLMIFALLLTGAHFSLSRSGFVGTILAGALVGAIWFGTRRAPGPGAGGRVALATCMFGLVAVLAFLLLPGESLIERFAGLLETENLDVETRAGFWADAWTLFSIYPIFGCGMGGYASAIPAVKTVGLEFGIDYAHNDYLQLLAEWGAVGFLVGTIFLIGVLKTLWRHGLRSSDSGRRLLAVGAASAVIIFGLHSLVDFTLYMPANAMAFAWVLGVAAIPNKPKVHAIWIELNATPEILEAESKAVRGEAAQPEYRRTAAQTLSDR